MDELLEQLASQQRRLLEQLTRVEKDDYKTQFHPELSPIGWHIGHCTYTEYYWIREAWLEKEVCSEELKQLYIPELSKKQLRGGKLPKLHHLQDWAKTVQEDNLQLIKQANKEKHQHPLLQKEFLIHFLIQHYAQHYETVQMILNARELQSAKTYKVSQILESTALNLEFNEIATDEYQIGSISDNVFYDNELPHHSIHIDGYKISTNNIKNSNYLRFMERGGYEDKRLWNDKAWKWLTEQHISHPYHWRQDENGHWYGIDTNGPHDLKANDSLMGINLYEATAFANWAKLRLPTEYEWEVASKKKLFKDSGKAWEWCRNPFHPYPGFKAFPYDGYSVPYFDKKHFTLKGGSKQTQSVIKRSSFRNYYQAEKRHIFAGFRLVAE